MRRWDRRKKMTRTGRRRIGVVAAVVAWAVGSGLAAPAGAEAPTDPGTDAAAEAEQATERFWVIDGEVLASRVGPIPSTGYGGHGVDYEPSTSPQNGGCG